MLIRVLDRKGIVRIDNLKRMAYERQGWCQVTEGKVGVKHYVCSCNNPCGYRAFPGVSRIRDLMWSDVMLMWRRVIKAENIQPSSPDSIQSWTKKINRLKIENRRLRDSGLITKHSNLMLLAKIPGSIIRGLAHDFPNEFSGTVGVRSEKANYHLEKTLSELYINREHGKPMGALAPEGVDALVLS